MVVEGDPVKVVIQYDASSPKEWKKKGPLAAVGEPHTSSCCRPPNPLVGRSNRAHSTAYYDSLEGESRGVGLGEAKSTTWPAAHAR